MMVLALIVFKSVPLEETVRLGLVEFMTEIKGSNRLTKHLNTFNLKIRANIIMVVAQFPKVSTNN